MKMSISASRNSRTESLRKKLEDPIPLKRLAEQPEKQQCGPSRKHASTSVPHSIVEDIHDGGDGTSVRCLDMP